MGKKKKELILIRICKLFREGKVHEQPILPIGPFKREKTRVGGKVHLR